VSDTVQLDGYVGPVTLADGPLTSGARLRVGNQGDLQTGRLNPTFYEQTLRGNAFVYSQAATGKALVAPATSLLAPMIWNPSGSGKNLVLHKLVLGYVGTNTWVPGHIDYGVITNAGSQIGTGAPIVSLTQVVGVNCLLGAGNVSVMRFCPSVCVTIAAPTFLCPTGLSTQTGTTGSVTPPWTAIDEIRGLIIVPPGVAFFVMSNIDLVAITCVALFGVELPIPPLA
jgi:hypothetical protein